MSETFADLVACEDVLMFVNAAITSTGQREFHHGSGEQRLSLEFLHEYMLENYRDMYAAVLALDVNDHNAAIIIRNLLVRAGDVGVEPRRGEGRLIARRLETLPPQRVYRLFRDLRRLGVNNRRTRAIIRDWMAGRRDPAFDSVKYRTAVKDAARHAHLRLRGEQPAFLFAPSGVKAFQTPIYEQWRRAHYEQAAIYELPYTVAEGFAAKHKIPREVFLERIQHRMTRLERLRLQESAREAKVEAVRADLGEMPLTRLASYVLALPLDDRARRRAELSQALRTAARRVAGAARGSWGRVTAVLDDSYSSLGSGRSAGARWRSRSPRTTCWRRSRRSTRRCGRRDAPTSCWCIRPARRRSATGSSTRWRRDPNGSSSSPTAGTTRRRGWPRTSCASGGRAWTPGTGARRGSGS